MRTMQAGGITLFHPLAKPVWPRVTGTVNSVLAVLMTALPAIRFCAGCMAVVVCFRAIGFRRTG